MSSFEPSLVRQPPTELDVGSDPELVERIRDEIRATGPITFARFMERALYEPGLGYYRRGAGGPGREGDFLTAPETHPIFGRAIARQLDELWHVLDRPDPFVLREPGAGTGALGLAIFAGLAADGSELRDALRYEPVEIDEERLAAIERQLVAVGLGERVGLPAEERIVGCILANEVLDALPVHRVVKRGARLRELFVSLDGDRFVDVEAPFSTPELAERFDTEGIVLRNGQRAEINLALEPWLARTGDELGRGLLLLIDYGHEATELYGPRRMAGTLAAYVRHRVHDNPFINVGRQDLTAHIDLTAVRRAAERAGLTAVGRTSQAEFLVGLGIGDLLPEAQADPTTTLQSYLELRSSVVRLLDPAATGSFRVMAFGRALPPEATFRGFAFHVPTRPVPVAPPPEPGSVRKSTDRT